MHTAPPSAHFSLMPPASKSDMTRSSLHTPPYPPNSGTLRVFSVVPTFSPGAQAKPSTEYVLRADDGRVLNLDMSQVPGVGVGPNAVTRCLPYTVTSAAPTDGPADGQTGQEGPSRGVSCESDADPALLEQLRKPGARIVVGVQQTLSNPRGQGAVAARSATSPSSILGDVRVTATSLRLLPSSGDASAAAGASPAAAKEVDEGDDALDGNNNTRRRLSVTRRAVNVLYAIVTACGDRATISANDLRTVTLPLYSDWFRSASYGRASLDARSTAEVVDVQCSIATTCRTADGSDAEDVIADEVKRITRFSARGFTNVIIAMPPAYVRSCRWGVIWSEGAGEGVGTKQVEQCSKGRR